MLLLKLLLIFSDAICMRVTATPPNPPRTLLKPIIPDWRERFLRSLALPSKGLRAVTWIAAFCESLVILASYNPSGPISKVILHALVFNDRCISSGIHIPRTFLFGNALTLVGTMMRVDCYRTLGQLFTFELVIQENHELITTGPYAIIRHPSYAGMILTIVGAFLSHSKGSWVAECGLLDSPVGRGLAAYWVLVAAAVMSSLLLRIPREDQLLMKQFGDEWREWAQRVPYSLVPGVY